MLRSIRFPEILDNLKKDKTNIQSHLENFKKEFLFSKTILVKHEEFLKNVKNITTVSITPRDFIVIYLFAFFEIETETDLSKISMFLIEKIHNSEEIDNDFIEQFNNYQELYLEWKNKDKKITLKQLTELYWELELIHQLHLKNEDDEDVVDFIENKKIKQKSLLDLMYNIDKLKYFNSYTPIVFDENIINDIRVNLKKAFWDSIKKELPSISGIIKILEEIRTILYDLVKNNNNIVVNYDEIIDINYIKDLNDIGATDIQYWFSKCSYLFSLLLELDSENNDEENKKNFNDLKYFIENTNNDIDKYYKCIDYLAYFMDKIIEIKNLKDSIF